MSPRLPRSPRFPSLRRGRRWAGACALAFGLVPGLAAQTPPAAVGPVVELPTFTVTDSRLLPPPESWRYARIPNFEILSNASDGITQRLLHDFLVFHQAVGIVWPAIQTSSEVPTSLILCANGNKFAEFVPADSPNGLSGTISLSLREREQAAIVVDLETVVLPLDLPTDAATAASTTGPIGMSADFTLQLHREYVHYLLQQINPRPPAWLEEGLAQIFMSMKYTDDRITFAKVEDPNRVGAVQAASARLNASSGGGASPFPNRDGGGLGAIARTNTGSSGGPPATAAPMEDADFNEALKGQTLLPMAQIFAVTHDSPDALNALGNVWPKQCAAFVHLCLYGEHQRYTKAFVQFVDRAEDEPVTEELFRQCFNMSYKDMLSVLRGYLDFTVSKEVQFRTKKGQTFPSFAPLEMRDATEAEVGRIKGDALRMAGRAEAAHLNLIAPYIRGARDPQLLAAIGIDEHSAGNDERARKFLEAAVAAHTTRARAYLELAQLRFAAAQARPAAPGGKLADAQVGAVLTPLFAAREQAPPLPEVYDLIAETWLNAAAQPTRENLGVVDEGVERFPGDGDLVYRAALLWEKIGHLATAAKLCDLGANSAADDAGRQRFVDLKTSLVTPPPQP